MEFKQKVPFTFTEPKWGPLKQIIVEENLVDYMYMGSLVLETVGEVHQYKHKDMRRSFLISDDGECYRQIDNSFRDGVTCELITKNMAFDIVFKHITMRTALAPKPSFNPFHDLPKAQWKRNNL